MRILDRDWNDGFLDYALQPETYRIQVRRWCVLMKLSELYYSPTRDWRLVWNYFREFGLKQVLRKVISRRREGLRNKKCVAFGIGTIMDCGAGTVPISGRMVSFLAPAHPFCVERIVLPQVLVEVLPEGFLAHPETGLILCDPCETKETRWRHVAGWSQYSGMDLDREMIKSILVNLVEEVGNCPGKELNVTPPSAVQERTNKISSIPADILRGVVFGFGHYAKTNILPNVNAHIRVVAVHEIDPTQIPGMQFPFRVDTSPELTPNEKYDVFFLAGFHHTHAPLAIKALQQGAVTVVEKPIATNKADLNGLLIALRSHSGKLFAGFHKRYSELNEVALTDMGVIPGGAVSYFCIVHEAQLPRLHWYRWPNSCGRLVSNGCHWIDHFLYLNQFSPPVFYDVWAASSEDVNVMIELANGASFTMTLTDRGSSRIGVEDYVELRSGDVTVRITNSSSYIAENSRCILRRLKVNRATAYGTMYASISARIVNGEPGDSTELVERSTKLVLDLQEQLSRFRGERSNESRFREGD